MAEGARWFSGSKVQTRYCVAVTAGHAASGHCGPSQNPRRAPTGSAICPGQTAIASYRTPVIPKSRSPRHRQEPDRLQATVRFRVLPGARIEVDHVVLAGLHRPARPCYAGSCAGGGEFRLSGSSTASDVSAAWACFRGSALRWTRGGGKRSGGRGGRGAHQPGLWSRYAEDDQLRFSVTSPAATSSWTAASPPSRG